MIFLTYKGTEKAVHCMIVSKIDNELYYAGNTNDYTFGELSKNVNFDEYDVKIVRIKDEA